ncbi:ATP-binding protein [Paenibacillus lautus]|uniref:ATP-binding protein n=1 Tax=Paenibacillus lautus TaxID=1401 RepID=UPI003D9A2999
MARILSHLGDQLISSSTVAILELIKNAYDAGSPSVKVVIDQKERTMVVEDTGHGMTEDDILNKYLVIGTADRLVKKESIIQEIEKDGKTSSKVPLGEKGLGRFATMKLGHKLVLLTKSKESKTGSLLMVNWDKFSYNSKSKLEDVKVHLFKVTPKQLKKAGYSDNFVKIKIYNLNDFCDIEEWDKQTFEKFYNRNFMKYMNPFNLVNGFQIELEIIPEKGASYGFTPEIVERKLLDQAPYKINGEVNGINLKSNYYIRGDDEKEYEGELNKKIRELEGKLIEEEDQIGFIKFEFYFFNRNLNRLNEIKGFSDENEIIQLLNQYSGGIMIFRDNFRVLPYAEPGNDWLELNSDSQFRASGIRFNTIQTVGAVYITSLENPNLKDQTNREGLVHNKAYDHLKVLLKAIIKDLRQKIKEYYPPQKAKRKRPIETEDVYEAIEPFKERIDKLKMDLEVVFEQSHSFNEPIKKVIIELKEDLIKAEHDFKALKNSMTEMDEKLKEVENQKRLIYDLAGVGMTAETAAHEMKSYLGRMTSYLQDLKKKMPHEKDTFSMLLQNTRALELVVSRIDIQSVAKRRSKSKINLVKTIHNIVESKLQVWEIQNREVINIVVNSEVKNLFIKVNEGMLFQVFDNLLNNSHYWLVLHSKESKINDRDKKYVPTISINISSNGFIDFEDNGYGILHSDAKYIFEPFFTRSNEGRGLGLYIITQILNFHESNIMLTDDQNQYGNYYNFRIDLSNTLR